MYPSCFSNASYPRVAVPEQFVEDGQIVLNISPQAVTNLLITNKEMHFVARFSGVKHDIYIPIQAVMAIYAMENEQGLHFDSEELDIEMSDDDLDDGEDGGTDKPILRFVE